MGEWTDMLERVGPEEAANRIERLLKAEELLIEAARLTDADWCIKYLKRLFPPPKD